ncbi:DUF2934 domain-containing protein [Arenibaculum pallidiluteum]|uniref:DUF2934 domain-containing protein n=1 Tax=Arenibaculum pallidiluteum TaxID=2812559 RepID=UPI001A95663D|nr:DUF2934 domain-containing protein [Arenibaculum pallidiluteum]
MDAAEDEIRRRAHAIWEAEGRPEGRHDEHWRQAASELGLPTLSAAAAGRRDAPAAEDPVSPGASSRGHMARARRKDAT